MGGGKAASMQRKGSSEVARKPQAGSAEAVQEEEGGRKLQGCIGAPSICQANAQASQTRLCNAPKEGPAEHSLVLLKSFCLGTHFARVYPLGGQPPTWPVVLPCSACSAFRAAPPLSWPWAAAWPWGGSWVWKPGSAWHKVEHSNSHYSSEAFSLETRTRVAHSQGG